MIRAGDRVAAVLARDERLLEVFTSLSPAFEKLRKPAMRKVMAKLVTIEQAARMAGIEPELLLARLNAVVGDVGGAGSGGDEPQSTQSTPRRKGGVGMPAALAAIPAELIVDLDVRPDLRRGEEPFSKIMAARREVPPGGVLRLCAIFEPVPLYAVLGKQGFEHWTEKFADDDWRVWFYSPATASPGEGAGPVGATSGASASAAEPVAAGGTASEPAVSGAARTGADDVVILDVRGLEPPEPMLRTFEALEELPVGKTLLQLNVRVPQFLLPQLAARGFTYEIREQSLDLVRIFIRHAADGTDHH